MDSPTEILKRHGLRAKKKSGQCFLHDQRVVDRIIHLSGTNRETIAVEIGAGLGILTCALGNSAKNVIAIEKDLELIPVLNETLRSFDNIKLIHENALKVSFRDQLDGAEARLVANLPYNVSSPLLFHALEHRDVFVSATVMLQKELAQRISAGPGSRIYGGPSVIFQHYGHVDSGFNVGRGAFTPAPAVDSSVIHINFRAGADNTCELKFFTTVVRAAFSSRRKMLAKSLSSAFEPDVIRCALDAADIDGKRRAETLSPNEFADLSRALATARE